VLRREIVQLRRAVIGVIQSSGVLTPEAIHLLSEAFDCEPSIIYQDARELQGKPKYGQRLEETAKKFNQLCGSGDSMADILPQNSDCLSAGA
jgi:hypothetical protein